MADTHEEDSHEPTGGFERWLRAAIELSFSCPLSTTAFSVGAVIVGGDGVQIATGHSRETDAHVHAEEAALAKAGGVALADATMYSSLEPCGARASRPLPCAQLIIAAGIRRVVYALREPAVFVARSGAELLTADGVDVRELSHLADGARRANRHLLRA